MGECVAGDFVLTNEEVLIETHKKERKNLLAEITKLKHTASKGDKKKKKEIQVQIAQLEFELEERQQKQLDTLKSSAEVESRICDVNELNIADDDKENDVTEVVDNGQGKKVSKAQRRRDKKNMKERQREAEIIEQDKINLTGSRHLEITKLKEMLKKKQLSIYEIPSDGNCLYAAVVHQLNGFVKQDAVQDLRQKVANFMRSHKDDFIPFMCQKNSGEMFTEDDFEAYCVEIESTIVWGGHHEIQAISQILNKPIEVLQSDSPVIKVGEDYQSPTLILLYMRHMYGLGEHYNSVGTYVEDDDT